MNILHLSTSDTGGGAARAAFRLHTGLTRIGVGSSMLVLKRVSADPKVGIVERADDLPMRLRRRLRKRQIDRDFAVYRDTRPKNYYEVFSDDRTEIGYDLARCLQQLPKPDIINLHWIGGMLDWQLGLPHLPDDVPVVWRLADMGPLTGGCHYDDGCGKFTARCGACPQLGSTDEVDLSRQVWLRKDSALSALPDHRLHVVGTSRWTAEQARRSSLFRRFPVSVIPNGLDVNIFSPRDKQFSRDLLGVPLEARVVLFVCESIATPRKGFALLVEALSKLSGIDNLLLLSVGLKPATTQLPQLHLGLVQNDRLLSAIYSAADVFVIPSLQESFGQTVTESLACGTPVAGFNTGGIPDMVRPGITGALAKVGDAEELAMAIKTLLLSDRREQLSANCRRIAVDEYAMDVQAKAYRGLYETLLDRSTK